MKHQGLLVLLVCCVLTFSVIAQQAEDAITTEEEPLVEASAETADEEVPADSGEAETTPTTDDSTVSKAPRQYPIAAGVWYPGEPVPTKARRYYRVRCWPGCHSYGEWTGPANPDHASPDSDE